MAMWRLKTLILLLGLMSPLVHSLRFDLKSGTTKCITEDIVKNALSVGKYSVINPNEGYPMPNSHKLTVRVTSPYANNYHYGDNVDSGDFAFTVAEAGDYMACFLAPDYDPPMTLSIEFEWKSGVAARDWSNIATKGQIDVMELELKKLFDTVMSIHDEMFHLRQREEEMQGLNRATNSKMASFSFLSLIVCSFAASLQLWHLKKFFVRKKLL